MRYLSLPELQKKIGGRSRSSIYRDLEMGSVMNFVYLAWPMRVLDTVTH